MRTVLVLVTVLVPLLGAPPGPARAAGRSETSWGAGTTELVSHGLDGQAADGASRLPRVSDDGRVVAFVSEAANLVADDTNGRSDVFVADRGTHEVRRVLDEQGRPFTRAVFEVRSLRLSGDGRYVVFSVDEPCDECVSSRGYVHDRETGRTALFARGAWFDVLGIASDGSRFLYSAATTRDYYAVFLRETSTGEQHELPVDAPAGGYLTYDHLSDDGSWYTVEEPSADRSRQDLYAVSGGRRTLVSVDLRGRPARLGARSGLLSAHGTAVAFLSSSPDLVAGDTNGSSDVFLRDLVAGATQRVSLDAGGRQVSGLDASGLDLLGLSSSGRQVLFRSASSGLVEGDTNGRDDLFVRDTSAGTTSRVSVGRGGRQAGLGAADGDLSGDGRAVAFASASPLVDVDGNEVADIYLRSTGAPTDGKYAVLDGAGVVPGPGDRDGRGVVLLEVRLVAGAATGRVCARFSATGLGPTARTAAHLHAGRRGRTGAAVLDLTGALLGDRRCVAGVRADLLRSVRSSPGSFYVDVHTGQFPDGAVRGQLRG